MVSPEVETSGGRLPCGMNKIDCCRFLENSNSVACFVRGVDADVVVKSGYAFNHWSWASHTALKSGHFEQQHEMRII